MNGLLFLVGLISGWMVSAGWRSKDRFQFTVGLLLFYLHLQSHLSEP